MGVGISVLIGLKATLLFLSFVYLRSLGFMLLTIPFLYASLVDCFSHINQSSNAFGEEHRWELPHLGINHVQPIFVLCSIFLNIEENEPYSEISEGLYVGGWPSSSEKLPPGDPAIIDCTCELPRMSEFTGHGRSVAVIVMCALLVALGIAEDWKNAEKIKQKWPYHPDECSSS